MGVLAQRLAALEARLDGADRRLSQTSPRLERVEARIGGAEEELRRLGDSVAQLRARVVVARSSERSPIGARRPRSAASAAIPPLPHPVPVAAVPPSAASEPAAASGARAPATPAVVSPPVQAAPPPAVDAVPTDQGVGKIHKITEKHEAAPADRTGAAVADEKDAPDLVTHLKRDWVTVKRGFATAGSDFRAAVDELRRDLNGGR